MAFRDFLWRILPRPAKERIYHSMLDGSTPLFSSFGQDVYVSDVVRQALHVIARESSKARICSVIEESEPRRISVCNDSITRLFRYRPNPLMTTQNFLYRVAWMRKARKNVFIYPQYETYYQGGVERRRYVAFYPLEPTSTEFQMDELGELYVKMSFSTGDDYILPYRDLIHLRDEYSQNIHMGGNSAGGADNREILKTVQTLDKVMQGLPKAIEASLQIKGVFTTHSAMDADKLASEREKFEEQIEQGKKGIVATDYAGEFVPININPSMVPSDVLEWLENKILKSYGVSMAMVLGDYTEDQSSALYQSCIEDFFIEFEQAATACCYTQREQDVGHKIKIYDRLVQHLSMKTRLNMVELGAPVGSFSRDEIRELLGYEPRGDNTVMQSLNWIDAATATQYQAARLTGEKGGDGDERNE